MVNKMETTEISFQKNSGAASKLRGKKGIFKALQCHGRGITPSVCHAWFSLGTQITGSDGMKCEFHQRVNHVPLGTILLLFPAPKNL